jgi:hypothetical protein
MNDNENLKNGSLLTPSGNTKREYTPRDLNDAQLAQMNHAEWLEQFSTQMGTSSSVKMTPFRQGVITRLHWAGKYVKLLERSLKKQEADWRKDVDAMCALRKKLEHNDQIWAIIQDWPEFGGKPDVSH